MQRREFITLLGGVAAAWPFAARAQAPLAPVIGFLSGATMESAREPIFTPFHRGLGEVGYVEGRNVSIEYRWAEGRNERLPELAADLVRRQVAVIAVGGSTPGALAAKAATQSVPIVFLIGTDPVAAGIVPNLARPGGNITGCTILNAQVISKAFQLLRELVPAVRTVGMLVNPTNRVQTEIETKEAQDAAKIFEVHLVTVTASAPSDIEPAFATLLAQRVGALLVSGEYFFTTQRDRLIALASEHRLPAVYGNREFTAAGGLMNFGSSIPEGARQVGIYVGRILKGENPSDLPVLQPTKFEFVINVKTAKTLGIEIPISMQLLADEVIE